MTAQQLRFDNIESQTLTPQQQLQLFAAIEQGLPLVAKPYDALAKYLNISEKQVISTIEDWQEQGMIRRFGLVIRHRKLGYVANAMVVWNVNDKSVDDVAAILSKQKVVTLCYRRPRVLPDWPYNLFCMIHGKTRSQVIDQLNEICQHDELANIDKKILFSNKAYKQRGGKYSHTSASGK
ncbi:hypothetical protein RI845_17780 [Thalassotalea nanhaiensis]|uniref:siroheme decarboxylase n=1 Tax=Thalassotalea nanhaiensis TaxID=3065648 RepID=A0ABY9THR5_9GAMM|nr:hypothetical protein RI845_17780 [Colwelliaceae bacterium SQ345]